MMLSMNNNLHGVQVNSLRKISAPEPVWHSVGADGLGLPGEPGVYRFRVPVESDPSQMIEFYALLRYRRYGVHTKLHPTFLYLKSDDEFLLPEGTEWRHCVSGDPETLGENEFPIVPEMSRDVVPCPFCKHLPRINGEKVKEDDGERYYTKLPYRFNRFWFQCCDWIAPAPRKTLQQLKSDWSKR